jgi:hypothetical protein
MFYKLSNILIGNLLLTLKYYLLNKSLISLSPESKHLVFPKNDKNITIYYSTIKLISSFFHKNQLNHSILFTMYTLLSQYTTYLNKFLITKSSIELIPNIELIPFINLFYFKIRNY